MDKECEICGISNSIRSVKYSSSAGKYLCNKHYLQWKNHKRFFDNNQQSKKDPNRYSIHSDTVVIYCDDKYGSVNCEFIIDLDDLERVLKHKWRVVTKRNKQYIVTGNNKNYPITYLSRFIMGYDGVEEVDHIDGNSLNNKKSNLRIANRTIQTMNLAPKKQNPFGIRGIGFDKRFNKYQVSFSINKKRIYIKQFKDICEAVYARYLLELKLNNYRYSENDEKIFQYINQLSDAKKREIELYIDSKVAT